MAEPPIDEPSGARDALLAEACEDDVTQAETGEVSVSVGAQNDGPQDEGPEVPTASLAEAVTIALSDEEHQEIFQEPNIGPYKVIRRIGQGGMGFVYLAARDDDQFKKQVAIKVVRPGMDTDFVLRRFLSERQILANLDHPNIARLLDGGTTEDNRPYFVMEHIEGKPITQYADEHRLSTVERLKLFREVCAAVHYAHQNLVIHRDIKPSNILVTAGGTPKLLDFGIAKLLNPDLAGLTVEATAVAVRLMTPEYASPEQVLGEQITTASDVYSLGVLLYELLTGHRPYKITSRLPHDIARVVCEQEPQKPSTAVAREETVVNADGATRMTLTPESVSRTRDGQPDKLRRKLSGDIDNIVLMAMRKEPRRRYASVDQLSNDILRHLEERPIIARTDTFVYRSTKFFKRHKAGALAALLILITLFGGFAATMRQRARAERRFNDVRQLANSFLFEFHDAIRDLPGSTAARELIVKRALEYLDSLAKESGNDPSLLRELATAYQKVGDVQGNPYDSNIGDTAGAIESFRKSLAIREKLVADDPSRAEDRRALAISYGRIGDVAWGKGDTEVALEAYRNAVAIGEALQSAGQLDAQSSRTLWGSYRDYAYALAQSGDLTAALESFKKGRDVVEKLVAENPNDPKTQHDLSAYYSILGDAQGETKDLAGALESFRSALAIDEKLVAADPNNVSARSAVGRDLLDIGEVMRLAGDTAGAIEHCRKALSIFERVAAADPADAKARRNVGVAHMQMWEALAKMGDFAGALKHARSAVDIFEKIIDEDRANAHGRGELAISYSDLGISLAKTGGGAHALDYSRKARVIAEELSDANPANAELKALKARIYSELGSVHAALASNEKSSVSKQVESWREARGWHQRGFEIMKELKDRGEWASHDYGNPDEVAAEIAKCDAEIAKLEGKK
ncbi:MAG TPA: protein kinase [Blastocatellia bacterium]|nr:protein kinase [Blastocatellia bacterium]